MTKAIDNACDLFRLDGRVAFVSGAAGHLGSAMARALAQAGAHVILNGRNKARLGVLEEALKKEGLSAESAAFDMMDTPALAAFMASRPTLHVLVNNAISMTPKAFDKVEAEDFATTYASAVTAAFEAVRAARPALLRGAEEAGDASIVNIASMYASVSPDAALYSKPGQMSPPHYGAAKAALLQLTRHLAAELGPARVRVNALAPGPFPRADVLNADPYFGARLAAKTMLRRTGMAEEIRGPVLFLASPASSFVTGAVLAADAGWTAW